jgi:putative aldouronate transport system substrate-binding protein
MFMAVQRRQAGRQPLSERLNRRTLLQAGAGAVAAGSGLLLPGRGGPGIAAAQGTPAPVAGQIVSEVPGVPDAFTQAPTPYPSVAAVPGKGGTVRMLTLSYRPPATPKGENPYWQELERRLGVTYDAELVPQANYVERVSTALAGGDLPDLFYILPTSTAAAVLYQAIEQGAFADLTEYLSGEALNEFPNLARYPSYLWENVRIDGRIHGVPKPVLLNNDVTFYRGDWAQTLGVGEITNAEDLFNLLSRMAAGDPNGNGNADTWGSGSFSGGWNVDVFQQLFRVPNGWARTPEGGLVNAIETEEYRQTIAFCRRLYEAGAYHPDAASMTVAQAGDALYAGQIGLIPGGFAAFFGASGRRQVIKKTQPSAELVPLIPPGHDGGQGVTYRYSGYFGFTGIPATVARDTERVKELLRVVDYLCAPFGSEEANFLLYGLPGVHHEEMPDGSKRLNDKGLADRSALVYPFLSENYFYYPGQPGEAEFAQDLNERMAAIAVENPVQQLYAPASSENGAVLTQLSMDYRTNIITGRQPLEAMDEWIREWRSRGGDQIRAEFEAALNA